jgi:hypothetical protein
MNNNSNSSSDLSVPTGQIITSLKADDGTSRTAMNAAACAAEQRWPLLKSLTPGKWAIAPTLTGDEKTHRNLVEPVAVVVRKTAASVPNINAQLANALNRMNPVKAKPLSPPAVLTSTRMVAPAVDVTSVISPNVPANLSPNLPPNPPSIVQPNALALDDSIQAVLQRVEKAHQPTPDVRTKVPGFLARLGKR